MSVAKNRQKSFKFDPGDQQMLCSTCAVVATICIPSYYYTTILLLLLLLLMHFLKRKHCCSFGILHVLRNLVVVVGKFFFSFSAGFLMSHPIKCNHFRSLIITCGDLPHILSVWICEHLWQVSSPPNPQLFNFVDLGVVHPASHWKTKIIYPLFQHLTDPHAYTNFHPEKCLLIYCV